MALLLLCSGIGILFALFVVACSGGRSRILAAVFSH